MKKQLNIAMIGGGLIAKMHSIAYTIEPLFYGEKSNFLPIKKVLCEVDDELARCKADEYLWQEYSANWREVVAREDIDIVDIAAPTFLHKEVALEAIKHGKAIYCEKPMGIDAVETLQMYKAADAAGIKTAVGLNKRRWPAVEFTKKLVQQGELGDILHITGKFMSAFMLDPSVPMSWRFDTKKAGSGCLSDAGAHSLDMIRYFCGEYDQVASIRRTFTTKRPCLQPGQDFFSKMEITADTPMGDVDTDDVTILLAKMKCGAMINCVFSGIASGEGNDPGFEVYGTRGSVKWQEQYPNVIQWSEERVPGDRRGFKTVLMSGPHPNSDVLWGGANFGISMSDCKTLAVHDFMDAVVNDKPFSPNFRDAHKIALVTDAVVQSSDENRWVKVPD